MVKNKKRNQVKETEKRRILFRGKCKANGMWYYGFLYKDCFIIGSEEVMHGEYGDEIDKTYIDDMMYCVEPKTVGQSTGLYDRNGKEIFEGDLIREFDFWDKAKEYVLQVEWKDTSCGFEPFSDSEDNCHHCGGGLIPRDCVVVGNIHDNPELLEVKL